MGLVEHQQQRALPHHRPAEGQLLPLPAGELGAVGPALAELRGQPVVETVEHVGGVGSAKCDGDGGGVVVGGQVAEADDVLRVQLEPDEVLETGGDPGPPLAYVDPAEVDVVNGDDAVGRVIEPAEQLDQRRLAGAVLPDDGDGRARRQHQVDPTQHRPVGARVGEVDIGQPDAGHDPVRQLLVGGRRLLAGDQVTHPAQPGQPLRDPLELAQHLQAAAHLLVDLSGQGDDQHHVADGRVPADRLVQHDEDGGDIGEREDQLTGGHDRRGLQLSHQQGTAGGGPESLVPLPDLSRQTEDPQLLGRVGTGRQAEQVPGLPGRRGRGHLGPFGDPLRRLAGEHRRQRR